MRQQTRSNKWDLTRFVFRFQRALAKAEEATIVTSIQREYERLQGRGDFFLSFLKGTNEESLKMFAERFSEIPMDVMTALKVNFALCCVVFWCGVV